ncbi:MAG: HAD family hydrolase [Candidatus Latescibacteria bacterium]|nr:HAD family hydrolase [Candidatus Latescibacterota bacterium]
MTRRSFVLLDRDGTVIEECNYLSDPGKIKLLPGVPSALRVFCDMGLGLAIITNQSAVGRGFFNEDHLQHIHHRLSDLLADEGICLDGIFYCPHTPEDHCCCRKPQPGLVEQAVGRFGFDPSASFVIGDKICDLDLGRRVRATTMLVRTGYGTQTEVKVTTQADYIVNSLAEAIPIIQSCLLNKT